MADTSKSNSTTTTTKNKKEEPPRQHGVKGVYYAGEWLDIEYCDGKFNASERSCSGCDFKEACPRSLSRNAAAAMNGSSTKQQKEQKHVVYDVLIVGAGCIGAAIARELSRYQLTVLWVEAADDVSQGATKGNSGIVHAGYDDTPGSNRAKYCWSGNQMFAQLDMELRFGYQKNGSLVVAVTADETKVLEELKRRGETNGVKRLRIIQQKELREMEPYIHPNAIAALYSPDAGNVIPYEFAIALAENAVDNGVELRIRRQVSEITVSSGKEDTFKVLLKYWEPKEFVTHVTKSSAKASTMFRFGLLAFGGGMIALQYLAARIGWIPSLDYGRYHIVGALAVLWLLFKSESTLFPAGATGSKVTKSTTLKDLVEKAGQPDGGTSSSSSSGKSSNVKSVTIEDMLVGGSGSSQALEGIETGKEYVHAKFIINCAGGASDRVAGLIGDDSFQIKPRVGDYILLHRDQGHLAKHTLFPCPDPVLGKGVLVQTTLWGNLILGPTARDMYKPEARDMSPEAIQEFILSKCKGLIPSFDAKKTIHAFAGARAKSTRGDWIIEPSKKNANFIHVAGIDSPGLAGAPAIALEVIRMLNQAGLNPEKNPMFDPNRAPIITPKVGMQNLKIGPVGKNDSDGSNTSQMASNVICKCEKVTELEVVRAMRRSLPIDSSQGIRKRTRAGMGHCQGDPGNYNCEARVRAIIARENGVPIEQVGGRPWPATSTLSQRWIDDKEKHGLEERKNKN